MDENLIVLLHLSLILRHMLLGKIEPIKDPRPHCNIVLIFKDYSLLRDMITTLRALRLVQS